MNQTICKILKNNTGINILYPLTIENCKKYILPLLVMGRKRFVCVRLLSIKLSAIINVVIYP